MTISKRTYIQENTESNSLRTNRKLYKNNNITSYILLLRKVTSYVT